MNNVSLQLQQYRALKAQGAADSESVDPSLLLRHVGKTDYFRKLMQHWEATYLNETMPFMGKAALPAETGETA